MLDPRGAGAHDVADLFGLRSDSVLRALAVPNAALDRAGRGARARPDRGWDEVYTEKTNSKRRNLHRRRRRQLAELGGD